MVSLQRLQEEYQNRKVFVVILGDGGLVSKKG